MIYLVRPLSLSLLPEHEHWRLPDDQLCWGIGQNVGLLTQCRANDVDHLLCHLN